MRRIAEDALQGYDDGELFLEQHRAEALAWEDGRLRSASFDTHQGFGLRCVAGEEVGFAQSNEISERALKRAARQLAAVRPGNAAATGRPPRGRGTNRALYPDDDPTAAISFAEKRALVERADAYIRQKDPRVAQVTVSLACGMQAVQLLRLGGARHADLRPLTRMGIQVVLKNGERRETGFHGFGGRGHAQELLTEQAWKHAADQALRQADVNLQAVPAPAGALPVVLGPGWPGILLHEAVGHGLEGDFNRKGLSAFAARMGEQVAAKGVTILDDGTLAGRRGSLSVDDEGTPPARTVLVEDGILKSYMHDRTSARLMGAQATGNGRRESFAHVPMPRMTNTYMLGGGDDPEELRSRVKDGLYAVSFGGGQVDITNGDFTFNCTEAYRIRDGKIAEPVKGANLIGNGPKAMRKVAGVGDDFALDPGIGTCGKDGQSVPVGVGQPSLLLSELTVGGTDVA